MHRLGLINRRWPWVEWLAKRVDNLSCPWNIGKFHMAEKRRQKPLRYGKLNITHLPRRLWLCCCSWKQIQTYFSFVVHLEKYFLHLGLTFLQKKTFFTALFFYNKIIRDTINKLNWLFHKMNIKFVIIENAESIWQTIYCNFKFRLNERIERKNVCKK